MANQVPIISTLNGFLTELTSEAIQKGMSRTHLVIKLSVMLFFLLCDFFLQFIFTVKSQGLCTFCEIQKQQYLYKEKKKKAKWSSLSNARGCLRHTFFFVA